MYHRFVVEISHVPCQPTIVPSLCGMLSRDRSLRPEHGICLVHRETLLTVHVQKSILHRLLIKECFTLGIKVLQAETQCEIVPGNLTQEVKKEIERQFQPRDFARRPSTVNSFSPAERSHRQNYMADQPRLQISELQFDKKSPHLHRFHVGR